LLEACNIEPSPALKSPIQSTSFVNISTRLHQLIGQPSNVFSGI